MEINQLIKSNPLFNLFSSRLKRLGYKVVIKTLNNSLVVENNNYLSKIVNVYIVYDLDYSSRNTFNTSTLKNCLFGTTDIIKNTGKCNYMYSDYAISSDRAGTSSFGNDFV